MNRRHLLALAALFVMATSTVLPALASPDMRDTAPAAPAELDPAAATHIRDLAAQRWQGLGEAWTATHAPKG